jgi:TRIAD3 protein (E3 ubiquitin-protein ligase RNF216)
MPFRAGGKGKGIEKQDNYFQEERAWLLLKLQEDLEGDANIAVQLNQKEYQDCEDGIECGCCFTTNPFVRVFILYITVLSLIRPMYQDKMVQCPDTHLFCIDCMTTYASNLLGSHNHNFVCMDQSGCKLLFTHSELRRFLPPKLLDLYERIKQTKEIQMAGLENLEECPHCEFKIVIDNPHERLFRCQNRHCEAVTCRKCKRPVSSLFDLPLSYHRPCKYL